METGKDFPNNHFQKDFSGTETKGFIRNLSTEISWQKIDQSMIPVTKNTTEYDSSYVVSPYAALVLYSRREMQKLPRFFHFLLLLLAPLSLLMKAVRMNQIVALNNWLLSTNIYPEISDSSLVSAAKKAIAENPESFVLLRSLNSRTNSSLIRELKSAGFSFLPSRQVYMFDFSQETTKKRPHNFLIDQKLLQKTKFTFKSGDDFSEADYQKAEELYGLLYLEKHSVYNPAFTADYFRLCQETRTMSFHGLLDESGLLQGVVGFFIIGKTMTVPIVGYNTKWANERILYRLLMAYCLRWAQEKKYILNLSSGASHFKTLRGGEAITELSAIYFRHLSWPRRVGLRLVQGLLYGIALPLLKIFKL